MLSGEIALKMTIIIIVSYSNISYPFYMYIYIYNNIHNFILSLVNIRKQSAYKISHTQATNLSAIEKLTIEIPSPNSQMFNISNWYHQKENSHYLQRTGNSFSELQPDTKLNEVTFADVNAHYPTWDQTAKLNARVKYLVNAAMDVNSTFLNDPPTRQDPATAAFSSPDATIDHTAIRDRYD